MNKYIISLITGLIISTLFVSAQDFKQVKSLSGSWKFTVGDDINWKNPNIDDSDWDQLKVPACWEKQGYDDYDGIAWYRKTFRLEPFKDKMKVYLLLGKIDDVDEVFLNGELIAKSGSFFPNFISSFDANRVYYVPKEKLKFNTENTLAIRVYDASGEGGIVSGKVGFYINYDAKYVNIPLEGTWKFKTGKDRDWNKKKFNDQLWDEILVPNFWEDQGYKNYDGYACYRKTFVIDNDVDLDNLYLILGKVDDFEYIYINGKYLGSYEDIQRNFKYKNKSDIWRNRRYYPIPDGMLVKGTNQITINIYDRHGGGGIYEGPVGITSKNNYQKIEEKYHQDRNIWETILEAIID